MSNNAVIAVLWVGAAFVFGVIVLAESITRAGVTLDRSELPPWSPEAPDEGTGDE